MRATSTQDGQITDANGDWRRPSVFSDPVSLVRAGKAEWDWAEVTLSHESLPERIRISVMKEPIRFDTHNGSKVRACVSARELQDIADHIGGIFHTSKTLDAKARAARTVVQPIPLVGTTAARDLSDRRLSEAYDAAILRVKEATGVADLGIVSSFGPCWVLTSWMNILEGGEDAAKSFLYGGHGAAGRYRSFQGDRIAYPTPSPDTDEGWTADTKLGHVFADLCRDRATLISPDGAEEAIWLSDIYPDEDLALLANYGGPLPRRQYFD